MNWDTIIRDVTRIVVSGIIVGGFVYCVIIHDSCADVLQQYAIAVIAAQLGIEGIVKVANGVGNGRYSKDN